MPSAALMGRAIDATGIQFRLLNRRKGPAMHSPRAQADKSGYQCSVKRSVEEQPDLDLRQEVVEDLLTEQVEGTTRIIGVRVRGDAIYRGRAVVLTTGTFLQAIMHTGEAPRPPGAGPAKARRRASAGRWRGSGFEVERFKTGTPPRLNGAHDRLFGDGIAAWRRRPAAVFVPDRQAAA